MEELLLKSLVGKTQEQATDILKQNGYNNITIQRNFVKPMDGSVILVVSAKLNKPKAELIAGSFKLSL